MTLLFGQKYRASANIFIVFNLLLSVSMSTFDIALSSLGQTSVNLAIIFYFLSEIIGAYFFTPAHGSIGAALPVLVKTVVLALNLSWLTSR